MPKIEFTTDPDTHEKLELIAAERGLTLEELMGEAVNLVIRKRVEHDDDRQMIRETINEMMAETQKIHAATVRLSGSRWYHWVPPITCGVGLVAAVVIVVAAFSI